MYELLEESEVKMYKIYENNGVYEIYSVYGQLVVSCPNKTTAEKILANLNRNVKIIKERKQEER